MDTLRLDPSTTAIILIDLQRGIVARPAEPHAASDVLARARLLLDRFRAGGATVVLVRVGFSEDGRDRLSPPADLMPPGGPVPPDFAELMPELGQAPGDLVITKRQWGAFHGTELDLQLRRRGVTTIVLGGISTNIGVESTARGAYERGYAQVFVEDATACASADAHRYVMSTIFPRLGRVRSTAQVLAALENRG
jgi:nicotinamidase-related amidase